jgi:hypothetical protein
MQTRDSDNRKQAAEEKRDLKLENIVGNLFIDEYQVDKLQIRLANLVCSYDYNYDYRPRTSNNNKASTYVFKHNNKWYKISFRVQEETDATGDKDGQNHIT